MNSDKKFKDNYSNITEVINKIKYGKNLSSVLTIEEVNLPDCAAYNVAKDLAFKKSLNTNQLRKIFEQIKECEKYLPKVEIARNELYKILPLIAYAVGRGNCPKEFFELINVCIKPDKLVGVTDVKRLIEFLTSIVAYFKFLDK